MSDVDLQKNIETKVLGAIHGGRARMRARGYFIARAALAAALAIIVLALTALVLSYIVFSVHESGEELLLGFGSQGIETFFALFPWMPLGIDVLLVLLLEWTLQYFKWGYRFSLLTLFALALAGSVALALLVGLTPLHASLLTRADRGELPLIGGLYASIRDSHEEQGIFRGTVSSIQGDTISIVHVDGDHDADDGTRTVMLPQGAVSGLRVGDRVYVFGTSTDEMVQAYGIGRLAPDQ